MGRTPWSDAHVGLLVSYGRSWGTCADLGVRPTEQHSGNQSWADGGVGRGPGGPTHESSEAAKKLMDSSTGQTLANAGSCVRRLMLGQPVASGVIFENVGIAAPVQGGFDLVLRLIAGEMLVQDVAEKL